MMIWERLSAIDHNRLAPDPTEDDLLEDLPSSNETGEAWVIQWMGRIGGKRSLDLLRQRARSGRTSEWAAKAEASIEYRLTEPNHKLAFLVRFLTPKAPLEVRIWAVGQIGEDHHLAGLAQVEKLAREPQSGVEVPAQWAVVKLRMVQKYGVPGAFVAALRCDPSSRDPEVWEWTLACHDVKHWGIRKLAGCSDPARRPAAVAALSGYVHTMNRKCNEIFEGLVKLSPGRRIIDLKSLPVEHVLRKRHRAVAREYIDFRMVVLALKKLGADPGPREYLTHLTDLPEPDF